MAGIRTLNLEHQKRTLHSTTPHLASNLVSSNLLFRGSNSNFLKRPHIRGSSYTVHVLCWVAMHKKGFVARSLAVIIVNTIINIVRWLLAGLEWNTKPNLSRADRKMTWTDKTETRNQPLHTYFGTELHWQLSWKKGRRTNEAKLLINLYITTGMSGTKYDWKL